MDSPQFFKSLDGSQIIVRQVAAWLKARGHEILALTDTEHYPDGEKWKMKDRGDITVILKGTTTPVRIEVKQRKVSFTSRKDYPYETVIFEECQKLDSPLNKKAAPLHSYVVVNAAATAALFIGAETRPYWIKKTVYDRLYDRQCTNYECPIERTKAFSLEAPAYV